MDLYESASGGRRGGRRKDRRWKRRERGVKERKSKVFTDPISGVPQWCGVQTQLWALSALRLNETANKRPQRLQTHHTQKKSRPSKRERNKGKGSKGRKGMLRKDEERQRQMEGGGGGVWYWTQIEIPFLCPASHCLAVWLTKAISSKQQVGMKI